MLFPENALFGFVLIDLAEALTNRPTPAANPLPCDRYVARSALQKAIRRGDVEIAQRALATLLAHDRATAWRHMIVIALEDVGVANIDLLARVVAARADRGWRKQMGGDWPVLAELVRQMATSDHCQAVCDLLLRATVTANLESYRKLALIASASTLAKSIRDRLRPIDQRAIAVLAIGGGLIEHQPNVDAGKVFCILGSAGYSSHVLAVCQAAWRGCRNPMSMLLPLLWQDWIEVENRSVKNDDVPPTQFFDGVPAYAIDQFTRVGGSAFRAYIAASSSIRQVMDVAQMPAGRRVRAVGDLMFLIEGSALSRRAIWAEGDHLRMPVRMLSTVPLWRERLNEGIRIIRSQSDLVANLRQQHFYRAQSEVCARLAQPASRGSGAFSPSPQ